METSSATAFLQRAGGGGKPAGETRSVALEREGLMELEKETMEHGNLGGTADGSYSS